MGWKTQATGNEEHVCYNRRTPPPHTAAPVESDEEEVLLHYSGCHKVLEDSGDTSWARCMPATDLSQNGHVASSERSGQALVTC